MLASTDRSITPEQQESTTDLVSLYNDACAHCGCRVNSSVSKMLAKAPTKVLDELSLRNNYVGPKGIHAVLFLIDRCQTLQRLDLSGNGLDNGAIEILCNVLQRHLSISHLDLSDNPITHDAGKFIMRLVEQNPRVVSLRVENTDIFPSLVSRITMAAAENAGSGAPEIKAINNGETTTKGAVGYPVPPPSRGTVRAVPVVAQFDAAANSRPATSNSPVRPSTRGTVVVATRQQSPPTSANHQISSTGVMKPRPPPPAVASAQHSRMAPSHQERMLEQYRQRRENYGALTMGKASHDAGQPNDVRDVVANTRFQLMSLEAADLRVQRRKLQQNTMAKEDHDALQIQANPNSSPRTARTATDRSARSVNNRGWMGSDQAMAEEEAISVSEPIMTAGTGAGNIQTDASGRDVVHSKDTNVSPFVIPYTKDEQFKVLFDAGCEAYAQKSLDIAYLRWNEAMTYAAEQKNREWIAIVTSNLQRLSYELLVAEGNAFVEKSRLDEADKRFAFAHEVAKKARNASWEQDMVRARKNVQHAVFTSSHERSTKLLEQVLKYQNQSLEEGEEFLAEGGNTFVKHTKAYHNEYQRLLLLKEAIEGWVSALAIARKITGPSSRVLQDVVNSSMLNVTEFLVQHWFASKDVLKVNGDMTVASKLGTCDFTFDEAKVLHDIWVDLINITESMGCKIFDVVSLMYVGHLAVAMNALQQAVSYFENAATIADASSQDGGAQKAGGGSPRNNNRPSSSTSNNNITAATTNPSSPNQLLSPVNAKTFTLDDPIVRGYIYSFLAELLWQRASFGAAEKAARRAVKNFEALQGYETLVAGDAVSDTVSKESYASTNNPNRIGGDTTDDSQYQVVGSSLFYKIIPTYAIRHTQYMVLRTLVHTLVSTHRYHDALETLELAHLNRHSDSLKKKIIKNFTSKPTIDHLIAVAASTVSSIVYYETATRLSYNPATGKYIGEESLYIWVVPPEGEVSFNSIQVTKDFGFQSIEYLVYQARNAMYVDPIGKMYWKRSQEEEAALEDGQERPDEPGVPGSTTTPSASLNNNNNASTGVGGMMEDVPDLIWKTPLQNLYALLIDPIMGFLSAHGGYQDCSVVTIVPTGALWGVPFTALLDAKDDTFFVEKFAPQLSFGALFTTYSVLSALQVAERAHKKTVVEFADDIDEATMNVVLRRYLVPFPSDAVRGKYEAMRLRKIIVEHQYEAQKEIEALHRTSSGVAAGRYGDVLSSQNVTNPYSLHDFDTTASPYSHSSPAQGGTSSSLRPNQLPGDDDDPAGFSPEVGYVPEDHLDEATRIMNVPPSLQPLSVIVKTQEELKNVLPHARFVHLTAPCTAYMAGTGRDNTAGGLCIASQERGGVSILRSNEIANTEIFSSVVSLSQLNLNQSALSGTYGAREGSLCLLRAFAAAGCPSVVGTLWCTPDMTPHTILEAYYSEYLHHTGGLQPVRPRIAAQHTNEGDVFSPLVTQKGRVVKTHARPQDSVFSNTHPNNMRPVRPTYPNKAVALALALRRLLKDPDVRYAPRQWAPYFMVGVGDE